VQLQVSEKLARMPSLKTERTLSSRDGVRIGSRSLKQGAEKFGTQAISVADDSSSGAPKLY
jgi:hypothetical protein